MVLQHHNQRLDHRVKYLISFYLKKCFSCILFFFNDNYDFVQDHLQKGLSQRMDECLKHAMLTANYDLRRGNFCNVFHSAENGVPHPIKETSFSNLEKSFPFSQGRAVPFFAK